MGRYDYLHNIRQGATQQQQDTRLVLFGHVSSYNPKTHAVKVMIPQYDDEDENPFITGWIPLGSQAVGDKFGIQYAPKGGATSDEPGKGEQCQVMLMQRSSGLAAVANLMWTDEHTPPGKGGDQQTSDPPHGDPDDPDGLTELKPGELVIRHESGSFIKFYENGDIQIRAAQHLKAFAQQNAELTVREGDCITTVDKGNLQATVTEGDATLDVLQGDVTVLAEAGDIGITAGLGDITASATAGDITADAINATITASATANVVAPAVFLGALGEYLRLCTEALYVYLVTHTHEGVMPGSGITSTPNDPPPPEALLTESTKAT